jgi:ferredoxin-NADP reductase
MYKYIVESSSLITNNILSLKVRAQNPKDIFEFKPGQYVSLSFNKNGRPSPMRCFSIASSSSGKGTLEFGIRVAGTFTKELSKLKPGDEISIMGPFGSLVCNPKKNDDIVLIAGGIGITPFLSMIKSSLVDNWQNKITLLYGARSWKETAYKSELLYLREKNSSFEPFFFLSDEPKKSNDKNIINGPITAEKVENIFNGNFENKSFYLCGPPGLMSAIKKILISKNVPSEKIFSEEFSVSNTKGSKKSTQSKVNLYAMLAIVISFIIILIGDAVKTNAKLISTQINSSATSISQNQSAQSQLNQNQPSQSQSNLGQTNINNSYSNPVTQVS